MNNNKSDIDSYSIFELMGLNNLSVTEQQDFLTQMEKNIWAEFLFLRLNKILSEEDLKMANEMLAQGKELRSITSFIESRAPNFKSLLLDFTRNAKIEMLEKQFRTLMEESRALKDKDEKISKYEKALDLLDNYKFEDLKNLWKENI